MFFLWGERIIEEMQLNLLSFVKHETVVCCESDLFVLRLKNEGAKNNFHNFKEVFILILDSDWL